MTKLPDHAKFLGTEVDEDLAEIEADTAEIEYEMARDAPEKTLASAIMYKGKLYSGKRHIIALKKIAREHNTTPDAIMDEFDDPLEIVDSYMTNKGNVITREQMHELGWVPGSRSEYALDVAEDEKEHQEATQRLAQLEKERDAPQTLPIYTEPPPRQVFDGSDIPSIKEALDRGAWKFELSNEHEGWGSKRKTYDIVPNDIPAHWQVAEGTSGRKIYYDPQYAEAYDDPEPILGQRVRLKDGVKDQFPEQAEADTIYRGMSHEDFKNGVTNKQFKSRGEYNIGDSQQGLTFYSSRPSQAQNYAHDFAPWQYKATPTRPAMVIATPDPKQYDNVTGQTELGLREPVQLDNVNKAYIGQPVIVRPGSIDAINEWDRGWTEGSRHSPGATTVWSEYDMEQHKQDPQQKTSRESQEEIELQRVARELHDIDWGKKADYTYEEVRALVMGQRRRIEDLVDLATQRGDAQAAADYQQRGSASLKCPGECIDKGWYKGSFGHCSPTEEIQQQQSGPPEQTKPEEVRQRQTEQERRESIFTHYTRKDQEEMAQRLNTTLGPEHTFSVPNQVAEPDRLDHIAAMPIDPKGDHDKQQQSNKPSAQEQALAAQARDAFDRYFGRDTAETIAIGTQRKVNREQNPDYVAQQRRLISQLVEMAEQRGDTKAIADYQSLWRCPEDCAREDLAIGSHGHCAPQAETQKDSDEKSDEEHNEADKDKPKKTTKAKNIKSSEQTAQRNDAKSLLADNPDGTRRSGGEITQAYLESKAHGFSHGVIACLADGKLIAGSENTECHFDLDIPEDTKEIVDGWFVRGQFMTRREMVEEFKQYRAQEARERQANGTQPMLTAEERAAVREKVNTHLENQNVPEDQQQRLRRKYIREGFAEREQHQQQQVQDEKPEQAKQPDNRPQPVPQRQTLDEKPAPEPQLAERPEPMDLPIAEPEPEVRHVPEPEPEIKPRSAEETALVGEINAADEAWKESQNPLVSQETVDQAHQEHVAQQQARQRQAEALAHGRGDESAAQGYSNMTTTPPAPQQASAEERLAEAENMADREAVARILASGGRGTQAELEEFHRNYTERFQERQNRMITAAGLRGDHAAADEYRSQQPITLPQQQKQEEPQPQPEPQGHWVAGYHGVPGSQVTGETRQEALSKLHAPTPQTQAPTHRHTPYNPCGGGPTYH